MLLSATLVPATSMQAERTGAQSLFTNPRLFPRPTPKAERARKLAPTIYRS